MFEIGTDIQKAANLLTKGEVVAIPTETVYGLAGNALNPAAVLAIFEAKKRPHFNPLIVHTWSMDRVGEFAKDIPPLAYELASAFWPGPITLLLPKRPVIHDVVTAGSDKVAVRIPSHPLTLSLLKAIPFPLAAPSANPFGYISPTTAAHVAQQLKGEIAYVLDGGASPVGIESTIIGFDEEGKALLYRSGGTSLEDIRKIAGEVGRAPETAKPGSPGRLKSHYAPGTRLVTGMSFSESGVKDAANPGALVFSNPVAGIPLENQVVLSPSGDLREAARNLFSGMRKLDEMGLDLIWAETLPEEGLGRAINDRLMRASA